MNISSPQSINHLLLSFLNRGGVPSFLLACLFFLPNLSLAEQSPEESPPKGEKTLPQRDTPVPKIVGYGDWLFTDSIESLRQDQRLSFIEKGQVKCEFGQDNSRDEATWPDCFYQDTKIFEEPAEVFILVNNDSIAHMEIHFDRRKAKKDSKACAAVINAVVDQLVKKFGIPTGKNDKDKKVFWESPYGGKLEFNNDCISEDRGRVLIVISPTPISNASES